MNKERKLKIVLVLLLVVIFVIIDLILGQFLIPHSYTNFRVKDTRIHHGLKADVSALASWGPIVYPMHINSLGFRDSSVRKVPLKSDKKRILILGDSHSEGVGIDYPNTYAGILQKAGEASDVEVLNASAVSYSPKIHYLKGEYLLRQKGLSVDEVWVVIDISDLQNEIAYQSFESRAPTLWDEIDQSVRRFFRTYSYTGFTLYSFNQNAEITEFTKAISGMQKEIDRQPYENAVELYKDFFSNFGDEDLLRDPSFHGVGEWIYDESLRELADQGLNMGFENISKLNEICRENNIKVRLSVHPWQLQVMKGDTTDYYVDQWRTFCEDEEIDFMNLYPLFVTEENPLHVIETCYIKGDNHWSEQGHKRVAEYLKRFVKQ